eukprot:GHVS01104085.1.p1 GENE.GHVS01104085.1~~GHVS01104085.1.p1  ORF type:complete len:591 (+),score=48.71 GHVS01104085.1:104-1876(+)
MFSWFSSAGPSIIPPVFLLILSLSSLCIEHSFSWGASVSSPLIAFALGTTFSNGRLLPSSHPFYEFAWSFILPAALTLTLVSGLDNPIEERRTTASRRPSIAPPFGSPLWVQTGYCDDIAQFAEAPHKKSSCLHRKVASVGVAYVLGAVGTLVGCYLSFKVATAAPLATSIYPYPLLNKLHHWCDSGLRFFHLSNQVAAQCAACLVATYIGGCINFFTVATSLRMSAELIGGLGAADMVLMGIYSAALLACRRLDCLLSAFPEQTQPLSDRRHSEESTSVNISYGAMENGGPDPSQGRSAVVVQAGASLSLRPMGKSWWESLWQGFVEFFFCAAWACLMLHLSVLCTLTLQRLVSMMGKTQQLRELVDSSATAFLTLVTVGCTCLLRRLVAAMMVGSVDGNKEENNSLSQAQEAHALSHAGPAPPGNTTRATEMEGACCSPYVVLARVINSILLRSKTLAKFGLILFYCSAGCRARWEDLTGIAPAAIMFCSVTVMVHGVLMFSLVACWNLLVKGLFIRGRHQMDKGQFLISLDELLVASDANVGGPSTAAAMAGGVMERPDLVLPATLWGTVGYTVATSLGMLVHRILS